MDFPSVKGTGVPIQDTATPSIRDAPPTILVVDDEFQIRELRATRGFPVLSAENAATALRYLESEPVDLVTADIGMPKVSGIELLRQIRTAWREAARILAIADGYHALMHDRIYRRELAEEDALIIKSAENGRQFDRSLTTVFFTVRDAFREVSDKHPDDLQLKSSLHRFSAAGYQNQSSSQVPNATHARRHHDAEIPRRHDPGKSCNGIHLSAMPHSLGTSGLPASQSCSPKIAISLRKSADIPRFWSSARGWPARRLRYIQFDAAASTSKSNHLTISPSRRRNCGGSASRRRGLAPQSHCTSRCAMPSRRLGASGYRENSAFRSPVQLRRLRPDRKPAAPAHVQGRTMAHPVRGTPWQS
jgi:CheY-like chemotaxis protein